MTELLVAVTSHLLRCLSGSKEASKTGATFEMLNNPRKPSIKAF
jgi:hypothetical protein